MPRVGMEPIRRKALVKATIAEIGKSGSLDVTVSKIARRAGVSSGLAHHYFGGKEDLLIATMRHLLGDYGRVVRAALAGAEGPRERVAAIVTACFGREHFEADVVAAWLAFYVHAQSSKGARRLLAIYQGRLRSNLRAAVQPVLGEGAYDFAEAIAALIDGIYLRQALGSTPDGVAATATAMAVVDRLLEDA